MKKTFTIFSLVLTIFLAFNALAQQKPAVKPKVSPKPVPATQPVASQAVLLNPQILSYFGYTEVQLAKEFKKVDNFFYLSSGCDEKCQEIQNKVKAHNSELSAGDVLIQALPKLKSNDLQKSATEYHAYLEELFAAYPSFQEVLGSSFIQSFTNPEKFAEAVRTAVDKGHVGQ